MTTYKELADRLDRSTRHDAYMHKLIEEAVAVLRSLDAQPVAEVSVMGSYRGKPILGCVLSNDSMQVGDKLYAAPVAAQPQPTWGVWFTPSDIPMHTREIVPASKPLSDADFAFNMLALMFDAYENGVPCYEDPEDEVGFIGYAYRLADDDFQNIATFLNRVRPVQSGIKERG